MNTTCYNSTNTNSSQVNYRNSLLCFHHTERINRCCERWLILFFNFLFCSNFDLTEKLQKYYREFPCTCSTFYLDYPFVYIIPHFTHLYFLSHTLSFSLYLSLSLSPLIGFIFWKIIFWTNWEWLQICYYPSTP